MRVGLIGCGRAGASLHLPALAAIRGISVTAVADPDGERLKAVADRWQVPGRFTDHRELAASEDVDIVAVCCPTRWHREAFGSARAAGKHIYVEKPLALSVADAEAMQEAPAGSRAVVTVGYNLRSHRLVERTREVIRSGELGRILWIRAAWIAGVSERPHWQLRRDEAGGGIHEMATHHFDLWRFLLDGGIESVHAATHHDDADDSRLAITAQMSGGAVASSLISFRGPERHDLEITGERASVHLSLYRADSLRRMPSGRVGAGVQWLRELPGAGQAARRRGDFLDSYRRHWIAFLGAIRGERPVPATLEDGLAAMRATALAAASAGSPPSR